MGEVLTLDALRQRRAHFVDHGAVSPQRVPEHEVVRSYGGRTALVGDPKDHATSDLISKVKALPEKG